MSSHLGQEPPLHNRALIRLLSSRLHRIVDGSLVALRVRGVISGSLYELPVMFAEDSHGTGLVVYPGRPDRKRWWRNLRRPAPVSLLRSGVWQPASGELLPPGSVGYAEALAAYHRRWPRVRVGTQHALVHISPRGPAALHEAA
jgi:hypothetical protein